MSLHPPDDSVDIAAGYTSDPATSMSLHWTPDVEDLAFANRLRYCVNANWKNVIDNFLEFYHCEIAQKGFRVARQDGHLPGDHARHLFESHGRSRYVGQQRV